ncbi:MAG: RNA polymerase Rpb4 [Candidatus Bathyarchaeota archaeon]|jgi:DNA-directed RNA polymerase subunit F|nr:RNA polymerase Rpb4 [Candidatus Bathyarchaeota archaeon]
MPMKIVSRKEITIAETRKLLTRINEPDQFQLRTLDYANKFAKNNDTKAEELVEKLIETFMIERKDAVQVVNCMPTSIQELRVFFSTGRKRIILTSQLEEMLRILNEYR